MNNFENYSVNLLQYDNANQALEAYVKLVMEQQAAGTKVIHKNAAIKKIVVTLLYAILLFAVISIMVFYHQYMDTCILILLMLTLIWVYAITRTFTTEKALRKKIQEMPDAEIDSILASEFDNVWNLNLVRGTCTVMVAGALLILAVVFARPHMIYEKNDTGYGVRYYTLSLLPESEVTIPDEWNGEPVTEIRGYVFCKMRGLTQVNLPKGITEIRGSTFEACKDLRKIDIPEGVVRIGGHAFCDCESLSRVSLPSTLREIGSSAFRRCSSLYEVTLPDTCEINERAFKESPTIIYRKSFLYDEDGTVRASVILNYQRVDVQREDGSLIYNRGDQRIFISYEPEDWEFALNDLAWRQENFASSNEHLEVDEVSELHEDVDGHGEIHWYQAKYRYPDKPEDNITACFAVIPCGQGHIRIDIERKDGRHSGGEISLKYDLWRSVLDITPIE